VLSHIKNATGNRCKSSDISAETVDVSGSKCHGHGKNSQNVTHSLTSHHLPWPELLKGHNNPEVRGKELTPSAAKRQIVGKSLMV